MNYSTRKYVILNYAFSWGLFAAVLLIGFGCKLSFIQEGGIVMDLVTVLYCWMPNIVLLLFFKKMNVPMSRKQFYRESWKKPIRFGVLLRILLLQAVVCIVCAAMVAFGEKQSLPDMFALPGEGILASAVFCLFTGATGEESGWRCFLLEGYRQRFNLLQASVFTGLVWAFWHMPVWLLSGYQGIDLLIYILAFIVSLIDFTIIMMYYYEMCRNLIILVFFHYMINFVLSFYAGNDILYQVYSALLYTVVAAVFVWRRKKLYLERN